MCLKFYELNTKLGQMWAAFSDVGIVKLCINNTEMKEYIQKHKVKVVDYSKEKEILLKELNSFFTGKTKSFNIPLDLRGTDFQLHVWNELAKVPYGEVRTYKDISIKIGCPKGYRAVGMANNRNPIPIIIPCHRIIGHNGDLVGFGGGMDYKVRLLEIEGHDVKIKETKTGKKYYII